ncbi:MAG: hypothetical protein GY855_05770 [candidate division Zixibacteria bacterium]|nr:hypothetical protein [candidate division Zixibacteria bacterium]
MKDKLKSRKFWIMFCSIAGLAGMAMTGEVTLNSAINKAVYIILGYFGANGLEHLGDRNKIQI